MTENGVDDVDARMAKLFERYGASTAASSAPLAPDAASAATHAGSSAPPAQTRRRRVWPFVTAGALLLAGATIAAGAYEVGGSRTTGTTSVLTAAVATTLHSRTADVTMAVTVATAGPALPPVTIAGHGDTNLVDDDSNLTLVYVGGGPTLTERAVIDGSTGYYNMGLLVGMLVPGKSWVSVGLGDDTGPTSGLGTGGIFNDPSTLIAVLGAEGTAVRPLGAARVDGAAVQEYAIRLGPAGIRRVLSSQRLPGSVRSAMASAHVDRLDYVVAVDHTDHLGQIRTTGAYAVGGVSFTVAATMNLSGFGTPVTVRPPPPGQVVSYRQFERIAQEDQRTRTRTL